jgi:hypothetical protein
MLPKVVELTDAALMKTGSKAKSGTRIMSPASLVSGTWEAAQIPVERLIGTLVVMDLNTSSAERSVDDDIAAGEGKAWKRSVTAFFCRAKNRPFPFLSLIIGVFQWVRIAEVRMKGSGIHQRT